MELTLYDLGVIADALSSDLGASEHSSLPPALETQLRADTQTLYGQVKSLIAAMDDVAEGHAEEVTRD